MTSVLLIRPLCEGDEPEFAEPLGIERLAGYLRERAACDVRIFDRRLHAAERRAGLARPDAPGFYDEVHAAYAETKGPSIVGLSLMTSADVPDARRIISRLGAHWPNALFVAGGLFVTTAPEVAAQRLPERVVLLRGEGEVQLLDLIRGTAPRGEGLGEQFCSPGPAHGSAPHGEGFGLQPSTPDDWAIPYRPHLERYGQLRCAVSIQASRGCSGACAFCATPALPRKLRRWSSRDEALVIDEVESVANRLIAAGLLPVFNFVDDDFGPLERLESLAARITARNLRVAFACEMRFASLAREPHLADRLACLHEAGLTRMFFGVESLDEATLSRWRKPIDVQALPEVLDCFRTAGVDVQAGYILWHGMQSPANAAREVERLHELGLYSHRVAMSRLIVFPGCALAQPTREGGTFTGAEATDSGFEPMSADAESFYQRLSAAAAELTREWTRFAIAEPYASAEAFLTGEDAHLESLREHLADINDRSYRLFKEMAS